MIKIIKEILKVFEREHLFEEGVELIGRWCFQLYQTHLGVKTFPLRSQDIDFLIPNPHKGKYHPNFVKNLENLGFKIDFRSDGSFFLWNADIKIEFLTPEKGKGTNKAINVKQLKVQAIPLRFVNLLLEEPITVIEDNIKILIPNPINFCFHKIIIASRRKDRAKRLKDLQQAIYTSVILNPKTAQKNFEALPRKWKLTILRMLSTAQDEMPLLQKNITLFINTLQNEK